jgi:hypothetical protein
MVKPGWYRPHRRTSTVDLVEIPTLLWIELSNLPDARREGRVMRYVW